MKPLNATITEKISYLLFDTYHKELFPQTINLPLHHMADPTWFLVPIKWIWLSHECHMTDCHTMYSGEPRNDFAWSSALISWAIPKSAWGIFILVMCNRILKFMKIICLSILKKKNKPPIFKTGFIEEESNKFWGLRSICEIPFDLKNCNAKASKNVE